jgi:hypothetical protein
VIGWLVTFLLLASLLFLANLPIPAILCLLLSAAFAIANLLRDKPDSR